MLSPLRGHPEVSVSAAAMEEAGGERKRKKTLGRQKIEIKRIECPDARHVCFSKRRHGLYKKAVELCVLTGAHVAIVVFSPAGKPYSFGHTSVNAVVDRYLDPGSYDAAAAVTHPAPVPAVLYDYERECERLDKAIQAEARRRGALDAAARAAGVWTTDDVRRKGLPDLVAMLHALERVQAAALCAHDIIAEEAMMQQCAAAGASDAFLFQYPGAGSLTADGGGAASISHQEVMDTQVMMLMGGDVSHAGHAPLPFAPMTLPPDLSPQPPFNYGVDHNDHIAGYTSYGYDLGDGSSNGAAYEMNGYCYGATATCNFFG